MNDVVHARVESCKRDAELPHDVCVVVACCFSSAHSAQAHADHDATAVVGYGGDVAPFGLRDGGDGCVDRRYRHRELLMEEFRATSSST